MFHISPFTSTHSFLPRTVLEQKMMQLSATIRSKPDWKSKYKNPSILKKWKLETVNNSLSFPKEAFDYVISELEYYDKLNKDRIEMSTVDAVWQSDELLPTELRNNLLEQVKLLESEQYSSSRGPDWHPGSNGQILDLLHPSLFCRHVPDELPDKKSKKRKVETNKKNIPHYQWIPSNVEIVDDVAEFKSRINNLDSTKYQKLYQLINQVFTKVSLPLFKRVISDWKVDTGSSVSVGYDGDKSYSSNMYPLRITVDPYNWYEENDSPQDDEDNDERELKPISVPMFNLEATLKNRNSKHDSVNSHLQVIVKIATIVLQPGQSYAGGSYHIEGTELENIFATQICYLESENISTSRLSFRCAVGEPDYEQNDNHGVLSIYGLENEKHLINNTGSVLTRGGRSIAFPNLFQHKVESFHLDDPSKPGYRRILVFFLVNPDVEIPSTVDLDPKQIYLYREELLKHDNNIPNPIWDIIVIYSGNAWTWEEACMHREKLMHERKYIQSNINDQYFERQFSLCEH